MGIITQIRPKQIVEDVLYKSPKRLPNAMFETYYWKLFNAAAETAAFWFPLAAPAVVSPRDTRKVPKGTAYFPPTATPLYTKGITTYPMSLLSLLQKWW